MPAQILHPTTSNIALAAQALRRGELVVIPTETVYGLAANALDPEAVERTYEAKGRPAENPLIVHVASLEEARKVVDWAPPMAEALAKAFWPGPLTLVLPKSPTIPGAVTAGLDTVAVRVPNHPVALEVIRAAGVPLAAPSANPYTKLSPTRIEHLDEALLKHVALVLDAGPCEVGVESTVLDLSSDIPCILRPGGISRAEIEAIIGPIAEPPSAGQMRSPGMNPKHYAPTTPVRLVDRADPDAVALVFTEAQNARQITMPHNPAAYASRVYAALHELDQLNLTEIQVELPPDESGWEAIHDRLRKAAS